MEVFLAHTKIKATKSFQEFWYISRSVLVVEFTSCVKTLVVKALKQSNNGKAERIHRIIMDMARCMLFASGVPFNVLEDAAQYVVYVLNRSPPNANAGKISPIEILTNVIPALSEIVVFVSPFPL